MPPAPLPVNEAERMAALRSYDVLDTECEAAFDDLARVAAQVAGMPVGVVTLIDGERSWFKARHGITRRETARERAFCAYTILQDVPLVVPDATKDARFVDNPSVTANAGVRFYAGIPLINPEGFALGSLCVVDQRPRHMSLERLETLGILGRMVMTTFELRRAMIQMRALAMTDVLTGLANRPAFMQALERAIARQRRHGEAFTLLYLDLDGFKAVNDTAGHAAGDDVLREVASVLRDWVRKEDVAARVGGDEFAAVLVLAAEDHGAAGADRIRAAIADRMRAASRAVTASVGAVCFRKTPPSAAQALSIADELMYAAKAGGKDRALYQDYTG
jgi:diguanylate cyclase (GGDEF)-like protein